MRDASGTTSCSSARSRLTAAIWSRRVPDYRLAPGATVHFSTGVRQADRLPLRFTRVTRPDAMASS